ncbi:nicotinate-nucleotide adenylyltransferase [Planctomicrobium piriforme]|uniref:Probable nicotinate-nucleotide adenylyltransferase n=1 Tax=Planctomicrobium piriforme TaxID=1576369 RepID=A0A1I3BI80_9PLAN|nr:nicotinate-nucleotide adenylyltransferase [Planctomicrobium piriforme]SFH61973.1 nicotinate-nucleotide adenylyltransferase [Planctomicrobium piriforme]
MNIGIFGGTFDPVHLAHLLLAEAAREAAALDEIWFMPAYAPPQKPGKVISPPRDRLEMVKLAIAGHVHFRVSKLEIDRQGTSYTVDTLRHIAEQRPDDRLFLLIGGDSLADLLTWRDPAGILDLATIIAVNRGRTPLDVEPVLAALGEQYRERIQLCEMPAVDISATNLRQRTAEGKSIRYQTPRSVELYIDQKRLYRDEQPKPATTQAVP